MSLVSGLVNQKIDTISALSKDGYGDDTATTVWTNIPCRWQTTVKHITNSNNEEVLSTIKVFLLPEYSAITYGYQITRDSVTYKVQLIKHNVDLDGVLDHIVLYLN